jgi:hypothetical protein
LIECADVPLIAFATFAHSSRGLQVESLNLKPQHMNDDEVSARLTSFGSPESQVRMQLCEFPIGSR